jgi:hypothetical protein
VDAGLESHVEPLCCICRFNTGPSFDAYGFSFCPLAMVLGRLLRIDPYKPHLYYDQNYEICRHCQYSMGRRARYALIEWSEREGNCPSPTYREGIERYKENPCFNDRFVVPDQPVVTLPILAAEDPT